MQLTSRQLSFGPYTVPFSGADAGTAPFLLAGRQLYTIGAASGDILPFGNEHLPGQLGGLWAHPVKVCDGLVVDLHDNQDLPLPAELAQFEDRLASVAWAWQSAGVQIQREDMVAPDDTVYYVKLLLTAGAAPFVGTLYVRAFLTFVGAWFSRLRASEITYTQDGMLLLGNALIPGGQWGVACGATTVHSRCEQGAREGDGLIAHFAYPLDLAPGAQYELLFVLAAEQLQGATAARQRWERAAASYTTNRAAQLERYHTPQLVVAGLATTEDGGRRTEDGGSSTVYRLPSVTLARDLALAQANLRLLEADYPALGPFLLAGLPEYPQLFGCDTCYTIAGAVAAGFTQAARGCLVTLAGYANRACGRVPHEVTTNGRVFHPGNVLETPLLAVGVWDYLRWTGDLALVRELYPILREGTLDLTLLGYEGWDYPYGDGIIERLGMGSRKLDSVCYAWAGLHALAALADAIGEPEAPRLQARAGQLRAHFERDWWLPEAGLYADSMHSDGSLQLDGHWTVVLPVQLGMADDERARSTLNIIEEQYVNEWGLVHTREREQRVWTLPTGLLALALFRHNRPERALHLLHSIGRTVEFGTPGALKELIPEGLCFAQLWSAGLLIQGLLEGLFGLAPLAHLDQLDVSPNLPAGWPAISLRGLQVGSHGIFITLIGTTLAIEHHTGHSPLAVRFRATPEHPWVEASVPVGGRVVLGDQPEA